MFQDYKYYLKEPYDFYKSTWFGIGLAVWVIGGVLRYIYELIFYWFNSGRLVWYFRGSTFGPWIDVYCIVSLLMFLALYKLRRQPWFVILISAAAGSAVQLGIGLLLYYVCGGIRVWNYNLEILNYGSLGGFICVRSAVEFAVLALLIIYVVVPLIFRMACNLSPVTFALIWYIIGFLCIADIVYNDIVCAFVPGMISAQQIYQNIGFKYMSY
ncbi:MAG: putative ABC transporter permease [Parasporobacterium sp.]|nr:putative ABC transporter permease [Parasporobacterium sp.]